MGSKKLSRKPEPKRGNPWPRWTGFRGMTLRDWLPIVGALLVPLCIALGTWAITWQQGKIEDQRAQDEALQAYLDQMSSLMTGQNPLRNSEEGSEVRTLARAGTLTVLSRLDISHKTAVIRFLVEGELLSSANGRQPSLSLSGADLRGIDFPLVADLTGADFSGTNLSNAELGGADLSGAYLTAANPTDTNLRDAGLTASKLSGTH